MYLFFSLPVVWRVKERAKGRNAVHLQCLTADHEPNPTDSVLWDCCMTKFFQFHFLTTLVPAITRFLHCYHFFKIELWLIGLLTNICAVRMLVKLVIEGKNASTYWNCFIIIFKLKWKAWLVAKSVYSIYLKIILIMMICINICHGILCRFM